MATILETATSAREASINLSIIDTTRKNIALSKIAATLDENRSEILTANKLDLERSEKESLAAPLLKRLKFDDAKITEVIEGIMSLIKLPEPVGNTLLSTELDKGLELYKVSCPIGVIGVIFESRPDALVQIATLCLKSSNAVLLKGGSEALETNRVLATLLKRATLQSGIPSGWMELLETRADVNEMLALDKYIDLIIPRGSNEFVQYIMKNSNIPVLGHADGICHAYVDEDADTQMAVNIVIDSKTQYVAVCNALETVLVHENIASHFLPLLKKGLDLKNTEIVGCEKCLKIIDVKLATELDWATEYLDYKISIKIVSSIDEAIAHINKFGSGHTDLIITGDKIKATRFMNTVDSGNVFWNCSTRFSDGFRYGFGAEVGISTNKIHARGPVGLDGLLIYKYKLLGSGQLVTPFANGEKKFTHIPLSKNFPL